MKLSSMTDDELNRAVALALGHELVQVQDFLGKLGMPGVTHHKWAMLVEGRPTAIPDYANDITAAWPIITAWKIELAHNGFIWCARGTSPPTLWQKDDDPITAAMRCFVAYKLGDDINLETK